MDPQPLVTALRAWIGGTLSVPSLPTGITRLAGQHRLNGTLYHIGADLSESDAAKAEESWSQNIAGHLTRGAALAAIWPTSSPAPLVFKGADLAENLFDDPGARAANDLDVLLPETVFDETVDAISTHGTRCPPPLGERFAGEAPYAVGLQTEGVLIEIHRHPQPAHLATLRGDALYQRSESGLLATLPVRFPTPEDRLLLWLTNQAKGAFFCDLAAWVDLCLILRQITGLDWRQHTARLRNAASAVGLKNAYDLAVVRLTSSGLWPGSQPSQPHRPGLVAANALLPPVLGPIGPPPVLRLQAVKTWLCTPRARIGLFGRALATLHRGERPGY